MQTQLGGLTTIGAGNVSVTGGAAACSETNTTPYVVRFVGSLSGVKVAEMTAAGGALTGTTTSAKVSRIQDGATGDRYRVFITNVGDANASSGAVVKDVLPPGLRATRITHYAVGSEGAGTEQVHDEPCSLATMVCELKACRRGKRPLWKSP